MKFLILGMFLFSGCATIKELEKKAKEKIEEVDEKLKKKAKRL